MKTHIAVILYVSAMISANLLVFAFGPQISPLNSFFLIGLDLSMRDWMHKRLRPIEMLALIVVSGALTFVLNPAAGAIAVASAAAFTLSALADWAVFTATPGSWLKRANVSNLAGAAVDSVAFPTLAFGTLMPDIVLAQFVAKSTGGLIWSLVLRSSADQENTQ